MKKYIVITTLIAVVCITAVIVITKETSRKYVEPKAITVSVNDTEFHKYAGITELLH
jgi:hypothetical protein